MGHSSSTLNLGKAVGGLTSGPVGLDAHDLWKDVFVTKITQHELLMALPPEPLRKMRLDLPGNLAALLFKCVEQLHVFNSTPEAARDPVGATNALLIIARILPFILEKKTIATDGSIVAEKDIKGSEYAQNYAHHVLWENEMCNGSGKKWPITAPLGKMLMQTLCASAFVPGFTLMSGHSTSSDGTDRFPMIEYNLLWCGGIGAKSTVALNWNETILNNRILLVKALLSCLSEEAFLPRAGPRPPLRTVLVDQSACPHASTLVASLLNTVVTYTSKGMLPYTAHWVGAREELVLRSTQLLCVLFDTDVLPEEPKPADEHRTEGEHHTEEVDERGEGAEGATEAEPEEKAKEPAAAKDAHKEHQGVTHHAAWSVLDNCGSTEFDVILLGMSKMLNNQYDSKNVNLPGSQRSFPFMEEFVILFFKMFSKNKVFLKALVTWPEVIKFVVPLLDFGLGAREDAAELSNLQLVIYMLMKLSAVREFCLACNAQLTGWMPFSLGCFFVGTYNDLLLVAMQNVISSKKPWMLSLHEPAATIIANLSAFQTTICMASAAKLMQLLDYYSKPSILEQTKRSGCVILACTVEAIANLIQYQWGGSTSLIYNLLYFENTVRVLHDSLTQGKLPVPADISRRLHVFTLICALDALAPQIKRRVERDPNADVYSFLKTTSLVGALPVPHSIIVRQFVNRPQTETWVAAWMWGCLFLHSNPLFLDARTVELFEMRTVPGATE